MTAATTSRPRHERGARRPTVHHAGDAGNHVRERQALGYTVTSTLQPDCSHQATRPPRRVVGDDAATDGVVERRTQRGVYPAHRRWRQPPGARALPAQRGQDPIDVIRGQVRESVVTEQRDPVVPQVLLSVHCGGRAEPDGVLLPLEPALDVADHGDPALVLHSHALAGRRQRGLPCGPGVGGGVVAAPPGPVGAFRRARARRGRRTTSRAASGSSSAAPRRRGPAGTGTA
jgi:hypothetical protein